MSDLLTILQHGGQSLTAHRAASATASHNLQNANTPGYSRQRAELEAVLPADLDGRGFIGRGVSLSSVTQGRDRFLEAQLPGARGAHANSRAESEALSAVNAFDPGASNGLTTEIGSFYASLRALTQNPADSSLRQGVVGTARSLTLAFARTARDVEAARTGLDGQLGGVVEEANRAASTLANLNREIRIAATSGAQPNDLLDARQRAVDKLTELVGARPIATGNGDITMALPGGIALVSGDRAARLATVADPANGGHQSVTMTRADGSGPVPVLAATLGGKAAGTLQARDGALANAANTLDQLAFDLAGTVNTAHRAGFGLDGVSGRDLFTLGATAAGAAASITVDAAIVADPRRLGAAAGNTTLPGDGRNLHALVATESAALSGGLPPADTLARIVSNFGNSSARAKAAFEQDAGTLTHLETLREATSGVSIDEELVNLTKSQRAYEAVMKVITTADDMLNSLMNLR